MEKHLVNYMIDHNKIPAPLYFELVSLLGKEKAEKYILKCNYNFRTISQYILYLRFKYIISRNPFLRVVLISIFLALLGMLFFGCNYTNDVKSKTSGPDTLQV